MEALLIGGEPSPGVPPAVADEFAGFSYAFRFASLEQPQHPDAAAGDAVAVSPFVFEEFAGGLLDERGVVVCHSKGGAQTNQKGLREHPKSVS